MAAKRSRKQIERIKKATRKSGRYVVGHAKSGKVWTRKSVGRVASRVRAYGGTAPATEATSAREGQPRPRVPLLSGGSDPTLGERFEEELHRS